MLVYQRVNSSIFLVFVLNESRERELLLMCGHGKESGRANMSVGAPFHTSLPSQRQDRADDVVNSDSVGISVCGNWDDFCQRPGSAMLQAWLDSLGSTSILHFFALHFAWTYYVLSSNKTTSFWQGPSAISAMFSGKRWNICPPLPRTSPSASWHDPMPALHCLRRVRASKKWSPDRARWWGVSLLWGVPQCPHSWMVHNGKPWKTHLFKWMM